MHIACVQGTDICQPTTSGTITYLNAASTLAGIGLEVVEHNRGDRAKEEGLAAM